MKKIILGLLLFFSFVINSYALEVFYDETRRFEFGADQYIRYYDNNTNTYLGGINIYNYTGSTTTGIVCQSMQNITMCNAFNNVLGKWVYFVVYADNTNYLGYAMTGPNSYYTDENNFNITGYLAPYQRYTRLYNNNGVATFQNITTTYLETGTACVNGTYSYFGDISTIGPYQQTLSNANIISIDELETGVRVGFTCDIDCIAEVQITSNDFLNSYELASGSFSGSVNTQYLDITQNLLYQKEYGISGLFTDINDPLVEIFDTQLFTYWYNPDPNNYQVGDFTFSPFDFTRLSNGFEIRNLDVNIQGGVFFLNLLAPNGFDTGLYTNHIIRVWDNHGEADIFSTGYGSGSLSQVTYPYHRWAGDYELLISFQYPGIGQELYPYGTGAINYSISEPEWNEEESQLFICDTNGDGFVNTIELTECEESLEGNFIENIWNFFAGLKGFFRELMKVGKVEPKEWGAFFLPSANAGYVSDTVVFTMDLEQDNILTDFYYFIKGFIIFAFLLLTLILILVINKKE